ncbi:MAG: helix-turn-helix domain-containing protein [Terracidiphilus sp.]
MDGKWKWVNRWAGQRVAQARKRVGLTQKGLAGLIQKSRASVANIEAGKQPIQIQMIFELAELLHVEPGDLIPVISETGKKRDLSEIEALKDIKRQVAASL